MSYFKLLCGRQTKVEDLGKSDPSRRSRGEHGNTDAGRKDGQQGTGGHKVTKGAPIDFTRTPKGHQWTPQGSTERPIETTRAQIGSLGNNGGHTRGANGGHKVTNGDHTRATGTPIEGTRGTRRTAKAAK